MYEPKDILTGFALQCARLQIDHDLWVDLFESGQGRIDLFKEAASIFFEDLARLIRESLIIQFCRITDPPASRSQTNLTTNYLLKMDLWPADIRQKLADVNSRLMCFRNYVEPARNKILAHPDLRVALDKVKLGEFPAGADREFLKDLHEFLAIASEHLFGSPMSPPLLAHGAYALRGALVKSPLYEACSRCSAEERAAAVLDYEERIAS
jgi:hypothetical protein